MLTKKIIENTGFRALTPTELGTVSGGDGHIIVTGNTVGGDGGGTFMGGGNAGGGFAGPPPSETQDAPGDPDAGNPQDPSDIGVQVGDADVTATLNEDGNLEVDVDASPSQFTLGVEFDLSNLSVENISVGWAGLNFDFSPDFSNATTTFTDSQSGWTVTATFTDSFNSQFNAQEQKVVLTLSHGL